MPTLNATEARAKLYGLIDEATASHEPVIIKGKRGNAVLISEEDWRSIQATMYLLTIPGMRLYKTGPKGRQKNFRCRFAAENRETA